MHEALGSIHSPTKTNKHEPKAGMVLACIIPALRGRSRASLGYTDRPHLKQTKTKKKCGT
jgi:hypothetical protein